MGQGCSLKVQHTWLARHTGVELLGRLGHPSTIMRARRLAWLPAWLSAGRAPRLALGCPPLTERCCALGCPPPLGASNLGASPLLPLLLPLLPPIFMTISNSLDASGVPHILHLTCEAKQEVGELGMRCRHAATARRPCTPRTTTGALAPGCRGRGRGLHRGRPWSCCRWPHWRCSCRGRPWSCCRCQRGLHCWWWQRG